ncbi:PBSX family phage terminase large subunit [Exiguobacterium sp. s21]|uniref:PBSX family phage terminase large subunit n=1 Tax=Exiguobacterium sp. s21 TaxID=2751244 RepID=UPI001BED22E7|nr:PBSX family phage terminase large subunit [Exiguobacterium sp. s21]
MVKTIKLQFNPAFKHINRSKHRYRVLKGSAGSGKSVNTAQDYILKLSDMRYKGANLLVVRKIDASNKDSTFAELQAAIHRVYGEDWPMYWAIRSAPSLYLESKVTGNAIIFRGMKDANEREKVKSINFARGKLTWIWVEEATELMESDLDILDDRLRGRLGNENLYYQITLTFNPVSATHWIKRKFFDYQDDDIVTCSSTYLQNRFIDEAYHRRMMRRKEQDPEGYMVYGLGEWGELGGLIFKNYEVKEFDRSFDRFDAVGSGQDFGFNHANALLLLGMKDGNIYVLRELYEHEKDTEDVIKLAERGEWPKNLLMICDSAEPDRISMWQKAGYKATGVKKGPDSVKAQIDWLKQREIYIHPECQNTYKEISQWKWAKDNKTNTYKDEPVNFFDDAMAALRYGTDAWRRQSLTTNTKRKNRQLLF